jgi:hypothetical protein
MHPRTPLFMSVVSWLFLAHVGAKQLASTADACEISKRSVIYEGLIASSIRLQYEIIGLLGRNYSLV